MNAFHKNIRRYGLWATCRQARNLGIDFIGCYVGIFGRMPRI